jgi:predicted AAA+ superfamily ATPase
MYVRSLAPHVQRALEQFRVVAIVGARQVGKSTLAQTMPGRHFVTLDDLGALSAAEADPRGFIAGLPLPVTVDEIQRVPRLLLAIKETVDRERRPGAFLVTGSSRLDTLRGLRESLAGRMALLTLRPMTVLELAHKPDHSPVERLFECKDAPAAARHFSKASPAHISQETFLAGGFPEPALQLNAAGRRAWFREYRKSYIERDVPAILRIEEVPALVRFLDACAATTAQLLNITDLARDTGVSVDTARRWLGLLEATFIAERRAPYWRNIRKRLVKAPKIFLCDSGLAASLTGVEKWPSGADSTPAGHLLETWMHAQLAALAELAETPAELHFYRTHSQDEVDFVLVRSGELIGIEVKNGATVGRSDADGIESMKEQFPKAFRFGLVLYLGKSVIPLSEHAVAVPLSAFFGS